MGEELRNIEIREQGAGVHGHNPSSEEGKNFDLKEVPVITQEEFGAIEVLKREGMKKKKVARILGLDPKTRRCLGA